MSSKVIMALDVSSIDDVVATVEKLGEHISWYKVGLQLFLAEGWKVIEYLKSKSKNIFLDLKFFDIPNTVAKATGEAVKMNVDFITIHALGTSDMVAASREAIDKAGSSTKILSVTILTSVSQERLNNDMGLTGAIENNVVHLASTAYKAGSHGIVCSPLEISSVRSISNDLIIVTPGVRFEGDSVDDQKRVMTPQQALDTGSNYLVMGRSLMGKENAVELLSSIK